MQSGKLNIGLSLWPQLDLQIEFKAQTLQIGL